MRGVDVTEGFGAPEKRTRREAFFWLSRKPARLPLTKQDRTWSAALKRSAPV